MAGTGQWRYIAQRYDGTSGGLGDFLDFNVPLMGVDLEDMLSGHNSLTGTISPEYPRLKGPDGKPILLEWGSAIWAEDPDGEIRGGGILTHSAFTGPDWEIECTDLTMLSSGTPYTEANFYINVDPLDLFREVWRHLQSHPGSNLGITIDGTLSGVKLGGDLIQRYPVVGEGFDNEVDPSAETDALTEPVPVQVAPNRFANNADWVSAAVKAMKAVGWDAQVVRDALEKWLKKPTLQQRGDWKGLTNKETQIKKKSIEKIGQPPVPPNGEVQRVEAAYVEPTSEEDPVTQEEVEAVIWEYDAYKLNWYTNLDLSATIDDLATLTPFDWHMTHRWYDNEIRHHIRLGYTKLGRRRSELRFVVGENIQVLPTIDRDGTQYANEVMFLGAGEGSATVIGRAFRRNDGRVRRVAVVSDPSVQSPVLAQIRAEQELAKRIDIENISEIVLNDHPHAPMGSVDIGDEILIEGETGWADIDMWVRVVARRISPDTGETMTLTVLRSDRLS